MLAKHALSQLSYVPDHRAHQTMPRPKLVGLGRLERPTSPLSGVRSNHLSYRPELAAIERSHDAVATGTQAIRLSG